MIANQLHYLQLLNWSLSKTFTNPVRQKVSTKFTPPCMAISYFFIEKLCKRVLFGSDSLSTSAKYKNCLYAPQNSLNTRDYCGEGERFIRRGVYINFSRAI